MGCDIHMFLERKRSTEKEWRLDPKHEVYIDQDDGQTKTKELHTGRSYEFFGHLAGVRYHATGTYPKGIPKNASVGFKLACEQSGDDVHSHSYVSISRYTNILNKIHMSTSDYDIVTDMYRDPFANGLWSCDNPFHIVLAYIHDIKESNAVNYTITNDPDYLDEKFRLIFFFDS
jgi:hypothetical protein